MPDHEKKPVINIVPAILTGTAALLAALTAMCVKVRNDLKLPGRLVDPLFAVR